MGVWVMLVWWGFVENGVLLPSFFFGSFFPLNFLIFNLGVHILWMEMHDNELMVFRIS